MSAPPPAVDDEEGLVQKEVSGPARRPYGRVQQRQRRQLVAEKRSVLDLRRIEPRAEINFEVVKSIADQEDAGRR